ncbi:type II toxin-antitoxin system HicB family antitoxin [Crocosphaera sp. XPORK-15E]|uniref:type II toxin-antitoxin system HicB family antitoxin n=1 Tax=Crocosphaera sp. XPORK-15E TaxID=3110247 RepID=UPI002B20DC85|nr:type II toxin-antitoxin system HicB family antitoxin [Crocosphaera sp. XPORK-15E]MEA5534753.1 type II toxin-antitoxin system HicB family antitoxin [Crocosphaera sp. XPORK-15E]
MTQYIATIHKESDSDYGVQFYDFPGCITAGTTLEEAKKMANEALSSHLIWMIEDGDNIPLPNPLETILNEPDHQDAIAFMMIETSINYPLVVT